MLLLALYLPENLYFLTERVRQVAKAGEVSEQDNLAFSSDQMTVISISRQSTEDHPTKKLSEHNTLQPPQKNQVLYDNEGTPKIEIPEGNLPSPEHLGP